MHIHDADRFRFGDFELDIDTRRLLLHGSSIHIRPRCFDVLAYLVRNAGSLVTRQDVLAAVWPGVTVSDDSLSRCISDIRTAINDVEKQIIRTVPGRGYHFACPVDTLLPSSEDDVFVEPSKQRSDRPSVAVLPFENMSGDPGQRYFSDGITEDIIIELGRFRDLFVIASSLSFAYEGQAADVARIGSEVGAAYIVKGSVRRAGDRVRITAQLLEVSSGSRLWAERYDREFKDIFDLQDEVVQAIVASIPTNLDLRAYEQAKRKPPEVLSAYEHWLKGISLLRRGSNKQLEALALFEKAAEIDPTYALAWSWIAYTYAYLPFSNAIDLDDAARKARRAIEQALELDDSDASIQAIAALVCLLCGEYDGASSYSHRAIDLNPNSPEVNLYHGVVLGWLGAPDEGCRWIEKAFRLSSVKPDGFLEAMSDNLYMQRNYADAIDVILRWRSMPSHVYAVLAACYAQLGRKKQAAAARAKFEKGQPKSYNFANYMKATTRFCKNQRDRNHWTEGFRKAGFEV